MPVKDGNNLYFMDCENDYRIAKVDLTNGEKTLVTDCRVDCYNVTGDKIFFRKMIRQIRSSVVLIQMEAIIRN